MRQKTFESEPLPLKTSSFRLKKFFAPLFFKKAAASFDLTFSCAVFTTE
jgi:hypothetical protein